MATEWITVRGAREHNLKDITVRIPRDKLIVLTGLSGSGKSSLAFDTIYAEGQRRYVESLSAYARQFLGEMSKPDVDHIEGLSPAISIDQKSASRNPRSTVGTITEIYDYLRVLYARIGDPHCPNCGQPIARQSSQQIIEQVLEMDAGTKFLVLAPLVRGRKGEYRSLLEGVRKEGFARVRIDGEVRELGEQIELDKNIRHSIEMVVDRLVMKDGVRRRLADSIETALGLAGGTVTVSVVGDGERMFSEQFACLNCGFSFPELSPRMFSFNSPYGACQACSGLGTSREVDPELVVADPEMPVWDGALVPFAEREIHWRKLTELAEREGFSLATPWRDLEPEHRRIVLYGSTEPGKYVKRRNRFGRVRTHYTAYEGVVGALQRRYRDTESDWTRSKIEEVMTERLCHACAGARLRPESLAVTVGGRSIHEFCRQSAADARAFLESLELSERRRTIAGRVVKEIGSRLEFMLDVGLNYLTLERGAATLSGGEAQRIRLATQIGSRLMGVLYILDEPSIGLHPRDNRRLIDTLAHLRDLGNTLVVVEHDEETMRSADYLVDLGPGAGADGGYIVAEGTVEQVLKSPESVTAQYLRGERKIPVPGERRVPHKGWLVVRGASQHNLKGIDVEVPLGLFVGITGVSGSGKSTLVRDILYPALLRRLHNSRVHPGSHSGLDGVDKVDKVIDVDQSPIGRTPRSNPATYTGVFDDVRAVYAETTEARLRGYKRGRFSFNVKGGRCESCRGDGTIKIEMHFLPDVYVPCEVCKGKRYNAETLEVSFKGKNIAQVLEMSVDEALAFFSRIPKIQRRLQTLSDVGLGYIRLGQPATTLSGGEAQRVKLATELSRRSTGRTLYLLDEPTTGLHFADIEKLLLVLNRLVEAGNTVVVIEHNLDVIKTADWLIDLGPEGGDAGGDVVAIGSPEELAAQKKSYTGKFLAALL